MKRAKRQQNSNPDNQDNRECFSFDRTLARDGVRYKYNQYNAATQGRQQRRIREEEKRIEQADNTND